MMGTNGEEHAERECVACREMGHWYNHCPKFDFWGSVLDAFSLEPNLWKKSQSDAATDL